MGYYSTQIVTNRGLEAITRTESGESILTFTTLKTGTGTYTQQEISKLDDAVSLKETRQSFPFNSIVAKEKTLRVESVVSNEGVTEEYQIREVGVFAKENQGEEFLVSISLCTDHSAVVPIFDNVPIEMNITDYLAVSNTENFTINYKSETYPSLLEFHELEKVVETKIDKKDAAPTMAFSNLESACAKLGITVKSYTTEEFAKAMPFNRYIQFTHRHDDAVRITDAPHPYASMAFQKGRTVNYFFGTSMHTTSGDLSIYKYNSTSTNNEWHKVITEWDEVPVATSSIRGGFKTGYVESNAGRKFPIILSGEEKAYVSLPQASSSLFGLTKLCDNLSSANVSNALTANQGKILNDKITFKALSSVTGTNAVSAASVFSGYSEMVLKVTTMMNGLYFSYTFTILTRSIGLGDGEEFFTGCYLNDGTHAFIRVRVSRTAAQIVHVHVSGQEKTNDSSLQIFYR